jgi:FkbM family methyltransferase
VSNASQIEQYEKMNPTATFRRQETHMHFSTPNRLTLWRVETILHKEPETIEWIEGFAPDDVFIDIGANVGMYSIWAARVAGARVIAFEPEAQNYALLCRNIALNDLGGRAVAYCAAIADQPGFGLLHVSTVEAGQSCHSFGDAVDFRLRPHTFPFAQGSFSATLDELVANTVIPQPQHVKIDVDGIEHKVVAGARRTFADARCKSVLIEINRGLPVHRTIIDEMHALGFSHSQDQADKSIRTEGLFEGCGNYVFRR